MNSANPSPLELTADPAWFPDRFDWNQKTVAFARMDRAMLAREAFLDERKNASVTARAAAPVNGLLSSPPAITQPAWIFHTAFCCSTLLARALDAPGHVLSLKEPSVTMDAANAVRMAKSAADQQAAANAFDLILGLLCRPHEGAEKTLVKPTNTANNLAPIVAQSGASVLFLYGDLKGFLISVLKKGEACKAFVRKQYTIFALDKEGVSGIPERQALGLTDLQIAALVWRHQMEMFDRLLSDPNADHLASLDFRALLDDPATVLPIVNRHLGLELTATQLSAAASSPVFSTDSKNTDQFYDAGARARDESELLARHETELTQIEQWTVQATLSRALSAKLPRPLISR